MNHCMTIRTNWNQIFNWVYFVFLSNFSNRNNMVNMNEFFANVAVNIRKIEFANDASITVVGYASRTSFRVAFVSVDRHRRSRTFRIFFGV